MFFPGDPVIINCDNDLKTIFEQMRIAATKDDPVDGYTKTEEDVNELLEKSKYLEAKDFDSVPRCIIYNNVFLSLCMSEDEYHGYNFHLSISQAAMGKMEIPDDQMLSEILDIFFSEWKAIPNPGVIKEIKHFVGNC